MSADFSTEIEMRGTVEELLAMIKVLHKFETEKYDRYCKKHDCEYVESVRIGGASDESDSSAYELEDMTDEEWLEFFEENGCEIYADMGGPWGRFSFLDEITLFMDMAEAAPEAEFEGSISGFNAGGDQEAEFELRDGLLYSRFAFESDDEAWDENEDDDWDDEDEDIDWDFEEVYDPIAKVIVESDFDNVED